MYHEQLKVSLYLYVFPRYFLAFLETPSAEDNHVLDSAM